MICEKCNAEITENSKFCKKCGSMVAEEEMVAEEPIEEMEIMEKHLENTMPQMEMRTSPLAVHMQEKLLKEDKKIKKKLARGRAWAVTAIILILLFAFENAGLIMYGLGSFDKYLKEDEPVTPPEEVVAIAPSQTADEGKLSDNWQYTYKLTKYWDADGTGNYATITETIESSGDAYFIDKDGVNMTVLVMPGNMAVDGVGATIDGMPEVFKAYLTEDGTVNIQMKGTEQKYFAAGGYEPLLITINKDGGTYMNTYDKFVSEMQMRYVIEITFDKM